MISKVLVIADATWQASVLILDAFQGIEDHPMEVRGIFFSCLIEPFKKNLGPNTLYLLLEEEEKALGRIKDYFIRSDIFYSFELITTSPLEIVRNKVREEDYDLIILQGEFVEFWRSNERNHGTSSWVDHRYRSPILLIKKSDESSLSYHRVDCETS